MRACRLLRAFVSIFVIANLVSPAFAGGSVRQSRDQAKSNQRSSTNNQSNNRNVNVNQNKNYNRNVNVNNNVNVNRNVNVNKNVNVDVDVHHHGAYYGAGPTRTVVVGGYYDEPDGWKVAAGVAAGIAIGTMIAKPPVSYTTVVVSGTSYYYSDNVYYARVYHEGQVVYQVVAPPAGAVIIGLPSGCIVRVVAGTSYHYCNGTYYRRVSSGYRVVVF
jgi:Family of unknown function (DUF6515)